MPKEANNPIHAYSMKWWAGKDSNLRRQKPPDLQSGPFDRFGTDPRQKDGEKSFSAPGV